MRTLGRVNLGMTKRSLVELSRNWDTRSYCKWEFTFLLDYRVPVPRPSRLTITDPGSLIFLYTPSF